MRVSQETGTPLALYKINYPLRPDTPRNMAWQYLQDNFATLKLKSDLSDLQYSSERETPGGYHVRFQQYLNGYPVYQGNLVVNINRQNRITL